MFPFGKKKEKEIDEDELLEESLPPKKKFRDLKPENKEKRKEQKKTSEKYFRKNARGIETKDRKKTKEIQRMIVKIITKQQLEKTQTNIFKEPENIKE